MKNKTTLTLKNISSSKVPLIIGMVLATVVDLAILLYLVINGLDFEYFIAPAVLLAVDIVFLILTFISNFRFRYSIGYFVTYLVLLVIATVYVAYFSMGAFQADRTATLTALIFWVAFHLIVAIVVLFSSLYAARTFKKKKFTTAVILLLVTSIGLAGYAGLLNSDGFFGQGNVGRIIQYQVNDTDKTCVVTGILDGVGDTVVIPEEFDGYKVASIDGNIFLAKNIKSVHLNLPADVEITLGDVVIPDDLNIFTAKEQVDAFKTVFYERGLTESNEKWFIAGNKVFPNIPEGDNTVFVSFSYDMENYQNAKRLNAYLPTWLGQKGDTFDIDDYADVCLAAKYTDINNIEHLNWADTQNQGYILQALRDANGNAIDNTTVQESVKGVSASFERVYRVYVDQDNDDLFELTDIAELSNFKSDLIDSNALGYRLVAESKADQMLVGIARDGFTLEWYSEGLSFTSLKQVLIDNDATNSGSSYTHINAKWELIAPTVSVTSNGVQNAFTYGDNVIFTASTQDATTSLSYAFNYSWKNNTTDSAEVDYGKLAPDEQGNYTVDVTVSAPTQTSLTATAQGTIDISIAKKQLTATWVFPTDNDLIYSGTDKTVSCSIDPSQAVETFIPTCEITNIVTVRDVDNYSFSVALTSYDDRYYIKDSDVTCRFAITPKIITINWTDTEQVYTGSELKPTVTAVGVVNSEDAQLTVSGATLANSHNVTVTIGNKNYDTATVAERTNVFVIQKQTVSVIWDSVRSFVYDGSQHSPTATATDAQGRTVAISWTKETNANTNHTSTASLTSATVNNNYQLDNVTCDYEITKQSVAVVWDNTITFEYNGAPQAPVATVVDAQNRDLLNGLKIATQTKETNYSPSNYTSTIALTDETNYVLTNTTQSYNITKQSVEVQWDKTEFIYNGDKQAPVASAKDKQNKTVQLADQSANGKVDASSSLYTATTSLDSSVAVNSNYELTNTSVSFTIGKMDVTVAWQSVPTVYNGATQRPNAQIIGAKGKTFTEAELTYSNTGFKDVGESYTTTVSIKDSAVANNYQLTETICTYTISPANLTITWNNLSQTYDSTALEPTIVVTGLQGNDQQSAMVQLVAVDAHTEVGTHTFNLTINSNYKTSSATTKELTITPRYITIASWDSLVFTYNGEVQYPVANSVGSAVSGHEAELIAKLAYRQTVEGKNQGSYEIEAYFPTNVEGIAKNYAVSGGTTNYVINSATITLTWTDLTKTYNGQQQYPTVTVASGLIGSDDAKLTVSGEINAGNYTVTATIGNANYKVANNSELSNSNFKINKADASVVWGSTALDYNGSLQAPSATVAGVNGNLTLNFTGKERNVGENYTVTAELASDLDKQNYNLLNTQTTFSIQAVTVTVIWGELTHEYDGNNWQPTVSLNGLKGSDTVADAVVITVTESSHKNVGIYNITVSQKVGSNYLVNSQAQQYSITPKQLNLYWNNISTTYNGTPQAPTVRADDGQVMGTDTLTFTVDIYDATGTNKLGSSVTDAGSYIAKATIGGASASNYQVVSGSESSFTILSKEVTVTWTNISFDVTATDKTPKATVNGLVSGDSVTVTITNQNGQVVTTITQAGTYTATVTLSGNYVIKSGATATVTVTEQEQEEAQQ